VSVTLKIIEVTGKTWEVNLAPEVVYSIGRSKDNQIVLNDQRVSRHHAHIRREGSGFKIIDGYLCSSTVCHITKRFCKAATE
jgi:predicted component of type VI protein secretion system